MHNIAAQCSIVIVNLAKGHDDLDEWPSAENSHAKMDKSYY